MTGSPSGRGPNGTFTDNAGNLSGRLSRWAVRTDGMESQRAWAGRALSAGGSSWESRAPPRTPHADPLASSPCPPQQFKLVARHGSGDATAPRPFETHPTIISWTSSRLLSRSRRHAATPSPPSLFSCDISDSVTTPPPQPQQIPQAFSLISPKKKNT